MRHQKNWKNRFNRARRVYKRESRRGNRVINYVGMYDRDVEKVFGGWDPKSLQEVKPARLNTPAKRRAFKILVYRSTFGICREGDHERIAKLVRGSTRR